MATTSITQHLHLDKLHLAPAALDRRLLAYLHSGDILRLAWAALMRFGVSVWLAVEVFLWIAIWPGIYEQFERWGLVKAFFAQLLTLATVALVARFTFLRAGQLRELPADDFVILRALALIFRWLAEIILVGVVGWGLSNLLQPLGPLATAVGTQASPAVGNLASSGSSQLLLVATPFTLVFIEAAAAIFVGLYGLAAALELILAIEFNTRADKAAHHLSS